MGKKTRADGPALRAGERGTDPETQAPLVREVFVFLDQCLALTPAAGRRLVSPAAGSSDLRFFDSSDLRVCRQPVRLDGDVRRYLAYGPVYDGERGSLPTRRPSSLTA
jgi:hypothetical protein